MRGTYRAILSSPSFNEATFYISLTLNHQKHAFLLVAIQTRKSLTENIAESQMLTSYTALDPKPISENVYRLYMCGRDVSNRQI